MFEDSNFVANNFTIESSNNSVLPSGLSCLQRNFPCHRSVPVFKLLDWGEESHRTEAEIASLRAAFTQEVAVWHKLDHPNVTKVLNGNPYNRKCDVYSFGICLWEIYCCDMPYPDLSFSEVTSAVVRQDLAICECQHTC
ncbi:serine/threonine-protein kinase STY46-like [Camellia sinensis]|uniref:serine/threonine-protein kinase STY46-like n=1 Tax=Camellia sinensis TaxID=4442 RepID=UPI0010357330|nr:serine/threonine-protein kinase STY46-like [Camellia sinensis]